jgi:hypothetical protein
MVLGDSSGIYFAASLVMVGKLLDDSHNTEFCMKNEKKRKYSHLLADLQPFNSKCRRESNERYSGRIIDQTGAGSKN